MKGCFVYDGVVVFVGVGLVEFVVVYVVEVIFEEVEVRDFIVLGDDVECEFVEVGSGMDYGGRIVVIFW